MTIIFRYKHPGFIYCIDIFNKSPEELSDLLPLKRAGTHYVAQSTLEDMKKSSRPYTSISKVKANAAPPMMTVAKTIGNPT